MFLFLVYDRVNHKVAEAKSPTLSAEDIGTALRPIFRGEDCVHYLNVIAWIAMSERIQSGQLLIHLSGGFHLEVEERQSESTDSDLAVLAALIHCGARACTGASPEAFNRAADLGLIMRGANPQPTAAGSLVLRMLGIERS